MHPMLARNVILPLIAAVLLAGCVITSQPPSASVVGSWVLDEPPYRAQPPVIVARERARHPLDGLATAALLETVRHEIEEIVADHAARGIVYLYLPDGALQVIDSRGVIGSGRWQQQGIAVSLAMEKPEPYAVQGLLVESQLVMQPAPDAGDTIEYFTSFFRRAP